MPSSIIGALRVTLGLDSAAFEKGTKKAGQSLTQFEKSVGGVRTGLGTLSKSLATLGVALSVGTIIGATKRALEYAASLGETAEQLGVTTEALQVYRFIATQVGITQDEMDNSLGRLSDSIAEAGKGTKAQAEAFNELRVNVKTADGQLKDTDRVIREMSVAFSKLENEQDKVRIGRDLIGKSGGKFVTAISGGTKAIEEWTKAAHEAGVVISSDDIQKADQLADDLAKLNIVLTAHIAGAVAENADAVRDYASSLGDLIGEIVDVLGWLSKLDNAMKIGVGKGGITIRRTGLFPWESKIGQQGTPGGITLNIKDVGQPAPEKPGATGLNRIAGGGRKGGGKSAADLAEEANRKRAEQLQRAFSLESDLVDAKAEELRSQQDLLDDYVERAAIEDQLIDIETDQQNRQLDLNVILAKLDGTYDEQLQTTTDQLKSSNERLRILKKQEENQQVELDRQRDFEANEATVFGIQRDMLEAQSQLAETQDERRKVELQLLDLAYRERKQALERIISESKNSEAIERARKELASLPAQRALDTQGVIQGTRGPLESFQASLPTTADKMNEALQSVAVDGLQALEDGILAVIDGTKSLVDAFRDMATQIIAELLRIQIERMIVEPVSKFLGGLLNVAGAVAGATSTGGTSAKALSSGKSFKISGFADGGVIPRGSWGVVGERGPELIFAGKKDFTIMPNEKGSTFNINVAAPNTGDPRKDRQTAMQQAVMVRGEVAKASRYGF